MVSDSDDNYDDNDLDTDVGFDSDVDILELCKAMRSPTMKGTSLLYFELLVLKCNACQ